MYCELVVAWHLTWGSKTCVDKNHLYKKHLNIHWRWWSWDRDALLSLSRIRVVWERLIYLPVQLSNISSLIRLSQGRGVWLYKYWKLCKQNLFDKQLEKHMDNLLSQYKTHTSPSSISTHKRSVENTGGIFECHQSDKNLFYFYFANIFLSLTKPLLDVPL